MKRYILFLFLIIPFLAISQRNKQIEGGLMLGASYYLGDLNNKHFYKPKIAVGILLKNNINKRINLRFSFNYSSLSAADSDSRSIAKSNRNLSFKTTVFEIASAVEINYLPYSMGSITEDAYTPYLTIGLGFFKMNPQAELNDQFYDLQTLGTEGQETSLNSSKKYKLGQIIIPIGVGFKANLTPKIAMSIEYSLRKTFTDYIDDVSTVYVDPTVLSQENGSVSAVLSNRSINQGGLDANNTGMQRGDSQNNDWYSLTMVMLTFRLDKGSTCRGTMY